MVNESHDGALEPLLIPTCVTLGAEEDRALVVVDTVHLPAFAREVDANLRSNQARRAGD
jgi:hypothetical protein